MRKRNLQTAKTAELQHHTYTFLDGGIQNFDIQPGSCTKGLLPMAGPEAAAVTR